jgi:hypothetical protein
LPGLAAFDLAGGSGLTPRLRSLDQQSAMAFHSPPAWRWRMSRYLPRSSRRLPHGDWDQHLAAARFVGYIPEQFEPQWLQIHLP